MHNYFERIREVFVAKEKLTVDEFEQGERVILEFPPNNNPNQM